MQDNAKTQSSAYGFWPSPISAELLTSQAVKISEPQACGERVYWLESRPQEQGRNALVCEHAGKRTDLLPAPHSIRTRAQEYGGAAYLAIATGVFYVLDADQRVYFLAHSQQKAIALTPDAPTPTAQYRYADFCYDEQRQRLLAVREDYTHNTHHPSCAIIAIDLQTHCTTVLRSGADFYSNPRLSPDAKQLSFLRWNHPQMPWDGTECICADLDLVGNPANEKVIAGNVTESIFQPQWSPSGELFFVSDRSNWWNIYRWNGATSECVAALEAEFATPQWVFGMSTYGFINSNEIFCCYSQNGQWQLATINVQQQAITKITTEFRDISAVHCHAGRGYCLAASSWQSTQLWCYAQNNLSPITSTHSPITGDYISTAQSILFTTSDNEQAQGFFYSPQHAEIQTTEKTLPPLIVMCHGGPTGATESSLNVKIQFWTSRGFAVFDINYRGSTGFGRTYRDRLKHHWGITDVIDVCSGAEFLAQQGLVDRNRMAIRGSSAGGYTVLAALTFSNTFKAGASLYGIGNLAALAQDTHKFEAHYLDSLVGEYPAQDTIYHARSPIYHINKLNCPVIFLQGLQDKVVPPSQAEAMVAALSMKGITTKYITFAEEGHGFRQAQNIQRALNEELAFYQTVFGDN